MSKRICFDVDNDVYERVKYIAKRDGGSLKGFMTGRTNAIVMKWRDPVTKKPMEFKTDRERWLAGEID